MQGFTPAVGCSEMGTCKDARLQWVAARRNVQGFMQLMTMKMSWHQSKEAASFDPLGHHWHRHHQSSRMACHLVRIPKARAPFTACSGLRWLLTSLQRAQAPAQLSTAEQLSYAAARLTCSKHYVDHALHAASTTWTTPYMQQALQGPRLTCSKHYVDHA